VDAGPEEFAGDRGVYLYGVVPAGEGSLVDGVSGIDPAFPVFLVEHEALAALVSHVPLDDFGEAGLRENLNRLEWLEASARAHEQVLEQALSFSAVLPARLPTVYRTDEHVRRMLEREHDALAAALARVRGTAEWGVKAFVERDQLVRWIEETDERAAALRADAEAKHGGAAYFARKAHDSFVRDKSGEIAAEYAQAAHETLRALAEEAQLNPLQQSRLVQRAGALVLNGAYLVRRNREASFRSALVDLETEYRGRGFRFELSGPWPPYNFVGPSFERGA
jgi:hypothetical protein